MESVRMGRPRIKVINSDFAKAFCMVCLFILFLLFAYSLIGFSTSKSIDKYRNEKYNENEKEKENHVCNCNCKFDADQKK